MKRVLVYGLVLSVIFSPTFAEPTLRDNIVLFAFIDGRLNSSTVASFQVKRHSVTEGQPAAIEDNTFLPALVGQSKKLILNGRPLVYTQFDVIAGRHKSSQVVDALASWGYEIIGAPAEMNFALEGTLAFTSSLGATLICKNVAIAQTGKGLRNHWHVFSKNGKASIFGVQYANILCTDKNGFIYEYQISKPDYFGNATNAFAVADGVFIPGFAGHPFPVKQQAVSSQASGLALEVRS